MSSPLLFSFKKEIITYMLNGSLFKNVFNVVALAQFQNHVFATITVVIKINKQFIRNSDEDELVLACCIAAGFSSENLPIYGRILFNNKN